MTETLIHPTAIIDDGALLGKGVRIWHWSHVCASAQIGNYTSLGQNVYVGNQVYIGSGVKIQNNVSVYDCVRLEDHVFCGPSVVFTNVINPRAAVPRKSEYKETVVNQGATLGANSTIICGVSIGRYAFVAAGAVVTKSIKDYALVMGVPAIQTGWMSRYGITIPLPLSGSGEWRCNHTNDIYILSNEHLALKVD